VKTHFQVKLPGFNTEGKDPEKASPEKKEEKKEENVWFSLSYFLQLLHLELN